MRQRLPIPVIAMLATMALQPGHSAAAPLVTIVDGNGSIFSAAGAPYRASPGVKLRSCDLVRTGKESLVQLEFEDDSSIALGGDGGTFVVDVPDASAAGVEGHVLVSGWAKLTVPQQATPEQHRLNTPLFDVLLGQGVAVVRVDDKGGELFVERGTAAVLARQGKSQAQVNVPAGRFYAFTVASGGYTMSNGIKQEFFDAMPRSYRDTLPSLRKTLQGRATAPARAGADGQQGMPQIPELRGCQASATVRQAQETLGRLGIEVGPLDGIYGPRTRSAVREFQTQKGLSPSGQLDAGTLRALDEAARR